MKRHLLVALLVLSAGPVWAGEWKLVWSDEFNEAGAPNPAKWDYETGFIRNNEAQYYTRDRRENARVEDGMLIIEARKERWKNPAYDPEAKGRGRGSRRGREFADYTSASLTTRGKASWTYGRIEVRAKLPAGRGTWPAIWMLGTNSRQVGWPACGEIDIMEFVGFEPGIIHANIHTKKYNHVLKTGKGDKITIPDASQTFHVYAVEWRPDRLDFFVDNQKYFTFRNERTGADVWPYDQDQYLILNLAIGGAWGGQKGIDDTIFPQRYCIDYVRVYAEDTAAASAAPKSEATTATSNSFEPAEIARVAALLPERTTCFGRPITDRAAWEKWAGTREADAVLAEAQSCLKVPMPEMTDEIYLIYSRTGSRTEADRVDSRRRSRIGTLTTAELLENKGRFLPELEKTIRSLCDEKTWVGVAHDGNLANFHKKQVTIDLYSSALAWNLATADNLLGDGLSPEIRSLIRREIQWRIFEPFHRMVEGRQSRYWLTATHNWNTVCLAGVTGAALALLDSREERAFYILAAEKYSKNFLKGFPSDGYCGEGTGYWNYGFGHYVLLAEEIRLATGGRIDLLARPEALAPASFGARFEVIDGIYPPFADSSPGSRCSGRLMDFLNERLGFGLPPVGSDRVRLGGGGLAESMMYLFAVPASRPASPAARVEAGGPRSWFDQAGVLICRPLPGSSGRLAAAIIGNDNGVNHNHNDVGSYLVVVDGRVLIVDPGGETYTARTFGPHRYDSNVLNSFGHSVPLVAGKMQDAGKKARAVTLKTDFTDARDTLVFDIGSAYSVKSLRTLTRTYQFSRAAAGSLTVTDEAVFSRPESFETALITLGQWQQIGPGTLRIEDGPAALDVQIDTRDVDFTIVPTQINEHVHTRTLPLRLAIRLNRPVQQATVSMKMTPAK